MIGGTLAVATHNEEKLREIAALFQDFPFTLRSAASLNLPEPEETGKSFAENAALKARAAAMASGFPALADDSGLVIPALDGAPGIYSARWAGTDKDFGVAFARIQRELVQRGIENARPQAHFICALCLALPDGTSHAFEGRVDGRLAFPPKGAHGFGYDPIFLPESSHETFGQMLPQHKQRISHRARAFAKLIDFLRRKA